MPRPWRTPPAIEAEVVVGDHEGGGLAGDVGAASAHGDADVGGPQRGGVVDAVAGHADDLAVGLQRPDELELLLGDHAGEHVDRADAAGELVVAHRGELAAR